MSTDTLPLFTGRSERCDDMDRPVWNSLGLCSGVGLLDLAVAIGCEQLGVDCRPAAACEWDSYAAATMLQRMEDQALEPCPIWGGDMRDFNAVPFRGVVDVLAAGLPCQPYSVAGKQLGNVDKRSHGDDGDGPIPQFLRIVAECRPAVVFCENVPPWVRGGFFRPVGEELCRLGYKIEDPLFITAESVGASHRRERVFVLAHSAEFGRRTFRTESTGFERRAIAGNEFGAMADTEHSEWRRQDARRGAVERIAAGGTGGVMAKSQRTDARAGIEQVASTRIWRDRPAIDSDDVADADEQGPQERIGERCDERDEFATAERGGSIFAPGPGADWRNIPAHLWPAIEPGLRFVADGRSVVLDASRADQLRCAGNAVVPLQAAVAFVELMRRVMTIAQAARNETLAAFTAAKTPRRTRARKQSRKQR